MEVIWMFPLFIIFPIVGLILSIIGILKVKKGESKSVLFSGLCVLALPLLYLILSSFLQIRLEDRMEGKYDVEYKNETLILKDDGTFELKSSINSLNNGNGTWEVEHIDFPILKLNFRQKGEVWLEIKESENEIRLSSMPGESEITSDFTKPYSR
jgi:hypothetical protein